MRHLKNLLIGAAFVTYAAGVYIYSLPAMGGDTPAPLDAMIHGTAPRPYVGRMLLPSSVAVLFKCIPLEVTRSADHRLREWSFIDRLIKYGVIRGDHAFENCFALGLGFLCFLAFFHALKLLADSLDPPLEISRWLISWSALGVFWFLLFLGRGIHATYIYDYPTLWLFTLSLGWMARGDWPKYLVAFGFASLSKETSLFLILVFALHYGRKHVLPRAKCWLLLLIQGSLYGGVFLLKLALFSDNPGGLVEHHLHDPHNLRLLQEPIFWFKIAGLVSVIGWASKRNPEKPRFLTTGVLIIVPMALLVVFFAWWDEFRDYYEVFPIVVLLGSYNLGGPLRWFSARLRGEAGPIRGARAAATGKPDAVSNPRPESR